VALLISALFIGANLLRCLSLWLKARGTPYGGGPQYGNGGGDQYGYGPGYGYARQAPSGH
jgi:hypothetical protein